MTAFKKTAIITLALTTFTVSTLTADAGRRERNLALGAIGGLVVGAAIANSHNRHYGDHYYNDRHYRPRRSSRRTHTNWCYNRYRSYDARSNTWVSYSGALRTCYSPYSG